MGYRFFIDVPKEDDTQEAREEDDGSISSSEDLKQHSSHR
jgi:hypothetical protein